MEKAERLCHGCHKRHLSSTWYYRRVANERSEEWLCGLKYLLLSPVDMSLWYSFPLL